MRQPGPDQNRKAIPMSNNTMTAEQAIQRSISHNEIVHIAHDSEAVEALTVRCDDHVEANEEHEFWGTDDDGNEWRVHVRLA